MADTDLIVLEDAGNALFTVDQEYRLAILQGDSNKVQKLAQPRDDAFNNYSKARLNLVAAGVLTTSADVAEMRSIKGEIDQAAKVQTLVEGAVRLAAFLAKFAF